MLNWIVRIPGTYCVVYILYVPGNPALCKPTGLDVQVHVTCFQDTTSDSVATFVSALHSQQLLFLLTPLEETWMLDP